MNNLKRFFGPVSEDKWMYARAILSALYVFGFELATISLLQSLTTQIQQGDIETLRRYLFMFVVAVAIFTIWKRITRDYTWVTIGAIVDNSAHKEYITKLIQADSTAVEKIWTGRLIAIMNQWLGTWRSALESAAFHVPEILVNMGFVVYMVSRLHWVYSLVFIVLLVLVSLFSAYVSTKANPWRAKKKHIDTELSRFDVRMIMSKQEIIQSGKLSDELDAYGSKNIERYRYASKAGEFLFYMYEWPVLLMKSFVVLIVLYAIYGISSGEFSYPTFVGLVAVWWIANNSVIKFTNRFKDFTKDFVHIEKLRSTFDELPQMTWITQWAQFVYKHGDIKLDQVSFSYADGQQVFSSLSLSLHGGKKTALVGSSGSGKSTLIKLIAWYIRPDSWSIAVDNQNLQDVSLQSYYKHIWYLTQEPSVFDGTIRENLFYAVADANITDSDLNHIIQLAQCQFIYDLPNGLDTQIGERWVRLSWWQRQRLAIAKIMLKNPSIILLDEPTSALDSFSEDEVTKAMNNLFQWRTVIIIAHRLQTVKHADDIIVIDQGNIIERGTHEQLITQWWYYAKMLELQSGF